MNKPDWFLPLINSIYTNLYQSLSYFWPSTELSPKNLKWPSEKNLLIELARFAHAKGGFIYPECPIKSIKMDAIVVLPQQSAVIQCELKHMYKCHHAQEDVERVSNSHDLDQFLTSCKASAELLSFSRFGLFLAFGHSFNTCKKWWQSGESEGHRHIAEKDLAEAERKYLDDVAELYSRENATVGLLDESESSSVDGKTFWLAYFFQALPPHDSRERPERGRC